MDAQQAGALFKQADALYQQGRHAEALEILGQLNEAFPNQKNVLWPTALSLNKLGRSEEAARICDYLVAHYGHTQADELRQVIAMHLRDKASSPPPLPPDGAGGLNLNDIDAMLDRPAPAARPRVAAGPDYKKLGLVVGGVLLIVCLLALPLLVGGKGSTAPTMLGSASVATPAAPTLSDAEVDAILMQGNPGFKEMSEDEKGDMRRAYRMFEEAPTAPASGSSALANTSDAEIEAMLRADDPSFDKLSSGEKATAIGILRAVDGAPGVTTEAFSRVFATLILIALVACFVGYSAGMYLLFSSFGKLPGTEISDNLVEIGTYALIFSLLCMIPILGWIAILIIMSKRFELSCGELAITYIVCTVAATAVNWLLLNLTGESIFLGAFTAASA